MKQVGLARRAFVNMLRAAAKDPSWAIIRLVFAPISAGPYLLRRLLILAVTCAVIALFAKAATMGHPILATVAGVALIIFILVELFKMLVGPMINHFGHDAESDVHGSARFASKKEIAKLMRTDSGLLIGRDGKDGKLLRYDGTAHLLTMAPTRTGKGVGTIIPNLLTADRSVICIDPKGENAKITYRARLKFGPVHIFDPFGITGQSSVAFNPLDGLDPAGLDVAEDASTLADALVHDEPGMAGEAHWNEEAKALIAGLILHIVANEPPHRRNLGALRELLTLPPTDFSNLLGAMQASVDAGGLIARAANRHRGKSDNEAAGVLSAAQRHTHFLDSPRMTAALGRSDVRFADLKRGIATIFLVLPPDRLDTYSRWLRLLVTQSLLEMARDPARPAAPILYLLDEFAALGHLAPVERAMGLMAGYGVQLWPILQDVHQLRATYGRRAGTFLSNAGVLQVFGVNDHESARLIADLLGQSTVVFQSMSRALDADKTGISYGQQHIGRPLLTPDEVRNFPQNAQLLFLAGQRPIAAGKLRYYSDREFAGMFDRA